LQVQQSTAVVTSDICDSIGDLEFAGRTGVHRRTRTKLPVAGFVQHGSRAVLYFILDVGIPTLWLNNLRLSLNFSPVRAAATWFS
jgi:hypothetical protein